MSESEIIELLRSYETDQNGVNFIGDEDYEEIAKEIVKRFSEAVKQK